MLKQFLKEGLIYGMSSIFPKIIGIVLIPFYTKVLSPDDYGVMNLIIAFYALLIAFSLFSMDNSSMRWYFDTNLQNKRKSTISSWFWFQLCVSLFIYYIIYLNSTYLSEQIFHIKDLELLPIANAGFLAGILPMITMNWFRMKRRPVGAVSYSIFKSTLTIVLTIFLVLYKSMGVSGVFYGLMYSNLIASVLSLFLMRSWLHPKFFNYSMLKEMLVFSAPLVPTALAIWVLSSSASFFIEHFIGKNELGLFQIARTLSSALVIFIFALKMAFPPFAYSIYNQKESNEIFPAILNLYTLVGVSMAFVLSVFSKELLIIFTQEEYYDAELATGVLFFYNIIYGYPIILGLGNSLAKNNKPMALSVFVGAAITLILFYLFIPLFGKVGAALAMLFGYLVIPIYTYMKAQRNWYIPFKPKLSIIVFSFAFLLFLLVNYTLDEFSLIQGIVFKLIYLLIYITVVVSVIILYDRLFLKKIMEVCRRLKKRTEVS